MNPSQKNIAKIILGLGAFLLLAFFAYQYGQIKKHDWRMNLKDDNLEPYGTQLVKELVKNHFAQDSFIVIEEKLGVGLPDNPVDNTNYIFIGEAMLMDSVDSEKLLEFIYSGHTALISSRTIPDILISQVYDNPCDSTYWEDYGLYYDTAVITNFTHPDLALDEPLNFPYIRRNRVSNFYWQKIDEYLLCRAENYPEIITQSSDSIVDMVLFRHGAGKLYLQTSPITFSNYYVSSKQGKVYLPRFFAHLGNGPIYWDGFSNVPMSVGQRNNASNRRPLEPTEGPLEYVLSQPPLAWAWYLLVTMGLLFLVFRAKRRQKMIPVLAPNRNTSLEFISTISRLHFTGENHQKMALQKMELMEIFIRNKYRLSIEDENFITKLSHTSEVDEAIIQKMFLIYTNIKSSKTASDKTLIELHKLTAYFYQHCR